MYSSFFAGLLVWYILIVLVGVSYTLRYWGGLWRTDVYHLRYWYW